MSDDAGEWVIDFVSRSGGIFGDGFEAVLIGNQECASGDACEELFAEESWQGVSGGVFAGVSGLDDGGAEEFGPAMDSESQTADAAGLGGAFDESAVAEQPASGSIDMESFTSDLFVGVLSNADGFEFAVRLCGEQEYGGGVTVADPVFGCEFGLEFPWCRWKQQSGKWVAHDCHSPGMKNGRTKAAAEDLVILAVEPMLGGGLFDVEQLTDIFDERFDFEWFLQEVVGSGSTEILDFVLFDHTADADDANIIEGVIAADSLANFLTVDIREHDIENDDVRVIFPNHHTGVESVIGSADFEATIGFEGIGDEFDEFGIVINDESLSFTAFEGIGGDAVFFHEFVKNITRNATEFGTRDTESS